MCVVEIMMLLLLLFVDGGGGKCCWSGDGCGGRDVVDHDNGGTMSSWSLMTLSPLLLFAVTIVVVIVFFV